MSLHLQDRFVFLSASYPARQYRETADSQEIASAVKAFLGAIFHVRGKILFGGHPSISPLVLMMAREYGEKGRVLIFQSRVFEPGLSEATLRLCEEGYGQIKLTNAHLTESPQPGATPSPENTPLSLGIMREEMLSSETNPAAAVFIGGDTGISAERNVFSKNQPGAPLYAVGGPGGAAREIAQELAAADPTPIHLKLATSRNYIALMLDVVRDIEGHLGRKTRVAGA